MKELYGARGTGAAATRARIFAMVTLLIGARPAEWRDVVLSSPIGTHGAPPKEPRLAVTFKKAKTLQGNEAPERTVFIDAAKYGPLIDQHLRHVRDALSRNGIGARDPFQNMCRDASTTLRQAAQKLWPRKRKVILDGWHRLMACRQLRRVPRYDIFEGDEAAAKKREMALNRNRRLLNSGQIACYRVLDRDPAQAAKRGGDRSATGLAGLETIRETDGSPLQGIHSPAGRELAAATDPISANISNVVHAMMRFDLPPCSAWPSNSYLRRVVAEF